MSQGVAHARGIIADVERIPVGHAVCLFRPDNWATALLNAPAAIICDALLKSDRSGPSQADPDTAALTAQLGDTGFLDPPRLPPPVAAFPAVNLATEPPGNCYAIGTGPVVGLSCSEVKLAALLRAPLAPLEIFANFEPTTLITVDRNNEDFDISRDGQRIASALDGAQARRIAIQSLMMALLPPDAVRTILHASTVCMNGQALILAGASGSGKSTLAAAMVAQGLNYLADDFSALDGSGTRIAAFPAAISIKHGSLRLLEPMFPDLAACKAFHIGERVVRYLDLKRHVHPAAACAAAAIIFPRYQTGAVGAFEPISPEEALSTLLDTGSDIVGAPRSIRPLANLVNNTPAFNLIFSDSSWACRTLLSQMKGR